MTAPLFFAACLLAGFPFGLLVKSRTEKRLRGNAGGWMYWRRRDPWRSGWF